MAYCSTWKDVLHNKVKICQSPYVSELGAGGLKTSTFKKIYISPPDSTYYYTTKKILLHPSMHYTHSLLLPAGFGIRQGTVQRSGLQKDTSKYEYIIATAKEDAMLGIYNRDIENMLQCLAPSSIT